MSKSLQNFMVFCLVAALSMVTYGCSGSSKTETGGPPLADVLKTARDAAVASATAARKAATDAAEAVKAVEDSRDISNTATAHYTRAQIAVETAEAAAKTAEDAAADAKEATTSEAAMAAAKTAEDAADVAAEALEDAADYANRVKDIQDDMDDDDAETKALTKAQDAAKKAATAARTAANEADKAVTAAEEAADEVEELLGPVAAKPARDAATAAKVAAGMAATAATDAESLNTDAQAAETSAAAEALQKKVEDKQGEAEGHQTTAEGHQKDAEELRKFARISDAQNEVRALADARDGAKKAATAARKAATAARKAANAAADSAAEAMKDGTDYANAKKEADAADSAATAAETAADAAEAALKAANEAVATDTMKASEVAKAQRKIAEDEQDKAEKAQTTAETAEKKAEDRLLTHVLDLFKDANSSDARRTAAAAAINTEAKAISDAGTTPAGENNATATASWPADTTDTTGVVAVVINAAAIEEVTSSTTGSNANASSMPALGEFQGLNIDSGRTQIIAYTDIEQATPTEAKTANSERVYRITVDKTASINETTETINAQLFPDPTGAKDRFNADYKHSDGLTYRGRAFCNSEDCSHTRDSDGKITLVGPWKFSGGNVEVSEDTGLDAHYLVFGVWLDTSSNNTPPTTVGVFDSGTALDFGDQNAVNVLTGDATYSGFATGAVAVEHAGTDNDKNDQVEYFSGKANLSADFGENDEAGSINGKITEISTSGKATTALTDISLHKAPLLRSNAGAATYAGRASMGASSVEDGALSYDLDGNWSGTFYGAALADDNKLPDSTAGTFGLTGSTGKGDDKVTTSVVGSFGANE